MPESGTDRLWVRRGSAEYLTLEAIGSHCILDLYDCPRQLLDDEVFVKDALRGSVRCGLATLLHEVSHRFHPQGVTALGLIAESHVSIHTWPEYGYVAADVFTCGTEANPEKACLHLVQAFRAGRHSLTRLARGLEALQGVTMAPSLSAEADTAVAQ